MVELTIAREQLKSDKAAGVDGMPPEILKAGGPGLHRKLLELLVFYWELGKLPSNLREHSLSPHIRTRVTNVTAPTVDA